MAIHIMLTVDLNGHVSSEARAKFYEILRQKGLIRRKLTTVWTAEFKLGATKESAATYVREAVVLAATASGVWDYEAMVQPSDVAPVEWSKAPAKLGVLGVGGGGLGIGGLLGK